MELINYNKWRTLADYEWHGEGDLPSGIVYVPLDHIAEFFRRIEATNNEYVVISAASDFYMIEQKDEPVWKDMMKWMQFVKTDPGLGYQPVLIPARAMTEHCKLSDRYSIKCYSFTKDTVNNIPSNVKRWYCTNNFVKDSRIVNIPFGVPDWTEPLLGKGEKKDILLYINFGLNTVERRDIINFFTPLNIGGVVVESGVSHAEYVDKLKRSKFVLSPCGNGTDCFRNLESIYCGAIPIMSPVTPLIKTYGDTPSVFLELFNYEKFCSVAYNYAVAISDSVSTTDFMNIPDHCYFEYWRNHVRSFTETW